MNLFLGSDRRPVHFVGIAGAGMSALAMVALRKGLTVTGSDLDPEAAGDLVARGAVVHRGHDPRWVEAARAVIVSAAVPEGHPEVERARALGLPIVTRKQALADLVSGARVIAIAGTHGKTTTTAMTVEALSGAGLDPTGLVGGRVEAWGGNARIGQPDLFVVEADEYDQAFLALVPSVAVVLNVEPEHLESYHDSADELEDAFAEFAGRAERAIVGTGTPGAERVAERLGDRCWRVGPEPAEVAVLSVRLGNGTSASRVRLPQGDVVELSLVVPGGHNVTNAACALAVARALDADIAAAAVALGRFRGVGRRFERLGERGGVAVVDDYAHHPTELEATLAAARSAYPGRRIIAVFQPHLYTRTARHGAAMGEALAAADLAWVTDVYPAREKPLPGVTGAIVADAARRAGAAVEYVPDATQLAASILGRARRGDVILTIGAGDITHLAPRLLAGLGDA